jgi:hypothetical protein
MTQARSTVLLAAALLAGCAGSTGSQSALAPNGMQSIVPPIQAADQAQSRAALPDSCDKAKEITIHAKGGAFAVPHCAG